MPGTVHPSDAPRPARSRAEKHVWERLRAQLPAGWTAWHSLRIRDRKAFLGETDFVLAHRERGLLVLEVKGGAIEQRGGRWLSNGQPLEAAPLDQARDYLRKLIGRLAEAGCQPPAWGAAVAFPDTDFERQPGQDDLAGVVLGKGDLAWLGEALPKVVERALPAAGPAVGDWLARLHALWGETWVPALSLGTRIARGRDERLELDERQLEVLDLLAEQDRALVQGGAGTGKTLLAVETARREAARGRRVLLLCFTQPLRRWLAARTAGSGVHVETVSGLAKRLAEEADGPWRGEDLGEDEVWRRYCERAADVCRPEWDAVVVDEAQDLTFEAWFLVQALAGGKRLWAFLDPFQGYWRDRAPPPGLFGPPFRLRAGRRSPPGIEALARRYAGERLEPAAEAELKRALGDRVLARVAAPEGDAARAVGGAIDDLVKQGVALADVGVVSLRGLTARGAVHHAPRLGRHAFVHADADDMEERLVADSFLRWKGLERPVIVVADVDPALREFGTRMHIALTRALTAARVVAPGSGGGFPGLDER